MASTLVINLVKYGLLALLWVFVLAAVRVVRTDLFASTSSRPPAGSTKPRGRTPKSTEPRRRSQATKLVVTEGALAGTAVALTDVAITLGRADESTLVITDDYASSHHARLLPGDGTWLIEDLGSTNGTYLGTQKVTRPTPVALGAEIRIGKTVLELRR